MIEKITTMANEGTKEHLITLKSLESVAEGATPSENKAELLVPLQR